MQVTKRISLSRSNLIGFGIVLKCPDCGYPDFVPGQGEPLSSWSCEGCNRPLAIVSSDGKLYYVGEKVIDREVEDNGQY